MQQPAEPVWVAQAPPFGAIAALAGFPDLLSVLPTAGASVNEMRVADWSALRLGPGRFLRLTQFGGTVHATFFVWWFGSLGPYEPAADPSRRCTVPVEGPRVCVQRVPLGPRDWTPILQRVLSAAPCEVARPADQRELRVQAFNERFQERPVCGAVAEEVWKLFDTLAAGIW